jgi:hypothetical protein
MVMPECAFNKLISPKQHRLSDGTSFDPYEKRRCKTQDNFLIRR